MFQQVPCEIRHALHIPMGQTLTDVVLFFVPPYRPAPNTPATGSDPITGSRRDPPGSHARPSATLCGI